MHIILFMFFLMIFPNFIFAIFVFVLFVFIIFVCNYFKFSNQAYNKSVIRTTKNNFALQIYNRTIYLYLLWYQKVYIKTGAFKSAII